MKCQNKNNRIKKGYDYLQSGVYDSANLIFHNIFDADSNNIDVIKGLFVSNGALHGYDFAKPFIKSLWVNDAYRKTIDTNYYRVLLTNMGQNAILFINNEKDFFSSLLMQEKLEVRKDISIISTSLLNTKWYIHDLKKRLNVPVSYSDRQIDRLQDEFNPFSESTPVELTKDKITIMLKPKREKEVLSVSDKLLLNIVDANNWGKPICFLDKNQQFSSYLKETNGFFVLSKP